MIVVQRRTDRTSAGETLGDQVKTWSVGATTDTRKLA
jgi:hypothetical protein